MLFALFGFFLFVEKGSGKIQFKMFDCFNTFYGLFHVLELTLLYVFIYDICIIWISLIHV